MDIVERLHIVGRNLNVANGNHQNREDMCREAQCCFDAQDEIVRLRADRAAVIRECAYIAAINGDPEIEEAILALVDNREEPK